MAPTLFFGTALTFQLLGNELVNLCRQLTFLTQLLCDELVHCLLLLLQLGHDALLIGFLLLHVALLGLVLSQQNVELATCLIQFAQLHSHLLTFLLYGFALCPLVGGILVHKAQATVHLVEILGAEHENKLALCVTIAIHIAHRADIVLPTLLQLILQHGELRVEYSDVGIDAVDDKVEAVEHQLFVLDVAGQRLYVLDALT